MKSVMLSVAGALLLSSGAASASADTHAAKPPAAVPAAAPVVSPRVVMLRLYVSDIVRSEKFYRVVLGLNVVQRMGDNVRIMMFPGGATPGIIMIQSPEVATMHGSFVLQVPDLQATLNLAAANGGMLKNTHFEQNMAGMPAQSSHFADPDGNLIEVLQMGGGSTAPRH